MCSGSEAGSYLRLIDFVYHSTLGLREIKKKTGASRAGVVVSPAACLQQSLTRVDPRESYSKAVTWLHCLRAEGSEAQLPSEKGTT